MAIPACLWLKDGQGAVDVQNRAGSIELLSFMHGLSIPTDSHVGEEEKYFNMFLVGVKVVAGYPLMHNSRSLENMNHLESVILRYEKITWKYCDENIQGSDL